jgi:arylformamidase
MHPAAVRQAHDLLHGVSGAEVDDVVRAHGPRHLEPLRHAPFLASDLRLDAAQARRLSPACFPAPQLPRRLIALVGEEETPEFHRQNRLIRRRWGADAVPVCEAVAGCHHMSILHTMVDAQSRTSSLTRQALGLAR